MVIARIALNFNMRFIIIPPYNLIYDYYHTLYYYPGDLGIITYSVIHSSLEIIGE